MNEANSALGWRLEYRQLLPEPFQARFQVREFADALLTREDLGGPCEVCAEPPSGMVAVVSPLTPTVRFNRRPVTAQQICVVTPRGELNAVNAGAVSARVLHIPYAQLQSAATALQPEVSAPAVGQALTIQADAQFSAAMGRAFELIMTDSSPSSMAGREALENLKARLVSTICGPDQSDQRGSSSRNPAAFSAVREYIEANLASTIRMEDLCRHANLGLRNLERLFVKELGLPPSRYILIRRLHAVRAGLVYGDHGSTLIGNVAADHGFAHLGRFSITYRKYFGESPSETLRRSHSTSH